MEEKNQENHIKKVKPAKSQKLAQSPTEANPQTTAQAKTTKSLGLGCIPSGRPPDDLAN